LRSPAGVHCPASTRRGRSVERDREAVFLAHDCCLPPGRLMSVATQALQVEHETEYDYSARVDLAYHIAYLHPLSTDYQEVDAFALEIAPRPSYRSTGRDAYGNQREAFSLYGPHEALRVKAASGVRVTARFEQLDPATSPPWNEVREELEYHVGATFQP